MKTAFVDIGSTIVKIAVKDESGDLLVHRRIPRDYGTTILAQLTPLLAGLKRELGDVRFRICSSANGGLRVGILHNTEKYSGRAASHLALSAGANVVFSASIRGRNLERLPPCDVLIVTGGIDTEDSGGLQKALLSANLGELSFQTLLFAGNAHVFSRFRERWPNALACENVLTRDLSKVNDVLRLRLKNAYLDDLVDKQGVAALHEWTDGPILPTPAVVNQAFHRILQEGSYDLAYPVILIDVGGATTDLHFSADVVTAEYAQERYLETFNRHVLTDVGVFASRENLLLAVSTHERLLSFFRALYPSEYELRYTAFRNGDFQEDFLFYACIWLALDRATSAAPGSEVPQLHLAKAQTLVISGGASQVVQPEVVSRLLTCLKGGASTSGIRIALDRNYDIWTRGFDVGSDRKCNTSPETSLQACVSGTP